MQSGGRERRTREKDFGLQSDQLFGEAFGSFSIGGGEAIVYLDVFPLRPSKLFEALPKRGNACLKLRIALRPANQCTDPPHALDRLSARQQGPRSCRTTNNTEKFPSPHIRPLATASYRLKQAH